MSSSHSPPVADEKPLVVIIAGSTGVGKSDVAALLCESRQSLLISADSVQAYRGVQIGANKPTTKQLEQTPHLLINVAGSDDDYNAATWTDDATYIIEKLTKRRMLDESLDDVESNVSSTHKESGLRRHRLDQDILAANSAKRKAPEDSILPIVVGGTMMYIQWLVHGRPDAPSPTLAAIDQAKSILEPFLEVEDWDGAVRHILSLHAGLDAPVSKLFPNDWYRLRRHLEVACTMAENGSSVFNGERSGGLLSLGYDVRCFFLCPHDRMHHTKIVDERCENMLVQGLLEETCDLALSRQLPDMAAKAIGYRQVLEYFGREGAKDNDYVSFLGFLENFAQATRQYARRQVQWFRKDDQFMFIPVDLTSDKIGRVLSTMKEINRMISLSRADFDDERQSATGLSAETRRQNEMQAKGMKTYMFRHHVLKPDSSELEEVLKRADACTQRFQAKRFRLDVDGFSTG
jgi:tRNA dimethylallyltransferase